MGLRRRVVRVRTDQGDIECEKVVDCGGMFAAEIARMVGVRVPIVPDVAPVRRDRGDVRAPQTRCRRCATRTLVYYRQEVDGLVMGGTSGSEPFTATVSSYDAVPADFNGRLLAPRPRPVRRDLENAPIRVPAIADAGIRTFINGPEAFTPDNEFCLGPTDVAGFFVAAGFCAHGIAGAGGIGKVVAEWVLEGAPPMDLWHMDVRRFGQSLPLAVVRCACADGREPLRPTTTSAIPRTSVRRATAARRRRTVARRARRLVRREVRLGAVNVYESNAVEADESWRPRGRSALVARVVASTARRGRRPRSSTSRRSRRSRCAARTRHGSWSGVCDNVVGPAAPASVTLHADAQRLARRASSATSR